MINSLKTTGMGVINHEEQVVVMVNQREEWNNGYTWITSMGGCDPGFLIFFFYHALDYKIQGRKTLSVKKYYIN